MWGTLSPNCRLAMAQYQCFSTYTPCSGLVPPAIYPLRAPASLCTALNSACTSQSDRAGVSITLSGSTTPSNLFSPSCAAPGSAEDALAQSVAVFASAPQLFYGRCEAYGLRFAFIFMQFFIMIPIKFWCSWYRVHPVPGCDRHGVRAE